MPRLSTATEGQFTKRTGEHTTTESYYFNVAVTTPFLRTAVTANIVFPFISTNHTFTVFVVVHSPQPPSQRFLARIGKRKHLYVSAVSFAFLDHPEDVDETTKRHVVLARDLVICIITDGFEHYLEVSLFNLVHLSMVAHFLDFDFPPKVYF